MIVQLPDGQELDFPDEASTEQIKAYVNKKYPQFSKASSQNGPNQGWQSVLKDLGESVASVPGALGSSLANLPGQAYQGGKQAVTNVPRAAENLAYGLLNGIQGATEIPANLAEHLKGKNVGPRNIEDFVINNTMRGNALTDALKKHLGPSQEGDDFIQSLGGFLPLSKVGALSEGIGGILKRAGAGGAYSASQNQDPIVGALTNMAMEAPGSRAGKLAGVDLRPTNMAAKALRGKLSPDELAKNLKIAEGTNTPLGRVIQDPISNTIFETLSSKALGSGKMLGNIADQVKTRANDVLESLRPEGVEGDFNTASHKILVDAFEKQRKEKNSLFDERKKIEDETGHILKLPRFQETAKDITKSIEDSPLYKDDPKFRKQYNELMNYHDTEIKNPNSVYILDKYGRPISDTYQFKSPSLTSAQVTAGDLYKRGDELARSNDAKNKTLGNNLKDLAGALREDISASIASGTPELQKAHAEANANYKANYSPFLDESVHKRIMETEPQTIVNDIIQPGKESDKYRDIEKVVNLLPNDKKNILAYSYLKKAEGDPKLLASRISKLGPRQLKSLIPNDELRQKVEDFGKLRGMNEKALNNMYNPETGIGVLPAAQLMWAFSHPVSALPTFAAAHGLNKVLTSPEIRSKIVNKMIEDSKKNSAPKASYSQKPTVLIQALTQAAKAKQPQKEEEK